MAPLLRTFGAFFLFWQVGVYAAVLLLPLPWGLLPGAVLFIYLLNVSLLRRGRPDETRRRAALRLRPLSPAAIRATLLAVPVLLAGVWAVSALWLLLVRVPEAALNPFAEITSTAEGRFAVIVLALVGAPILEEFVFRGVLQSYLQRRAGPALAIVTGAAVFAVLHFNPWVLPIHLALGLAFGYAVWATRSIWSGVVLHAANNAVATLGLRGEATPTPTVWETGDPSSLLQALGVLVIACGAAVWVGRQLVGSRHAAP